MNLNRPPDPMSDRRCAEHPQRPARPPPGDRPGRARTDHPRT
jgi:hypothetical protein